MISKYFNNLNETLTKNIKKKNKAKGQAPAKGGLPDLNEIREVIANIIPSYYNITDVKLIDSSSYASEDADLIIYKDFCPDITAIFDNHVPSDLVYGTIFLEDLIGKANLESMIKRVSSVKKIDYFTDTGNENKPFIPSFIICSESESSLGELKEDLVNYYMDRNLEHEYELDILIILNKGIIIKDWKDRRSFKALETGDDTMLWFFILLNEYIDYEKQEELDFRKYIKKNEVYKES